MSNTPIRDRVRARRRDEFLRRITWVLAVTNFVLLVMAFTVFG